MKLLKQIETLFQAGTAGGLSDGLLLERFLQGRDESAEAAFAALVDRHGAMVLRVCRQVLGDEHDAQDASQATFLVLARRAGSIGRRESVASWLHGVALRVAARARLAASRRRARERRGGEMMAARLGIGNTSDDRTDEERWSRLHDELGRLPESFRTPIILCYLEGLTQEQAAAQLRCPLGTIQSRLARGRAKLKTRLEKRGADYSACLLTELALAVRQHAAAPQAWAEATVRLAMRFARADGSGIAGAASAALAEEVLRVMALAKLKVAAGIALMTALLVSGAAAWAMQERDTSAPTVAAIAAVPPDDPEPPAENAHSQSNIVKRKFRGTVRDEHGRPVAKAWVGSDVKKLADSWEIVEPFDRIRERKQPYLNERGNVVPAGSLGKYFELRDQKGNWQPIHPAKIRRHDPSRDIEPFDTPFYSDDTKKAMAKGQSVYEVRTAAGRWEMSALVALQNPADRTDTDGHFEVEVTILSSVPGAGVHLPGTEVHFASPDFTLQAVHVVAAADPNQPVEITLKPTRLVRARLIETPVDNPSDYLDWCAYSVDATVGNLHYIDKIRKPGAFWENGDGNHPNEDGSLAHARRLEILLPAGSYRFWFESDTLTRLIDIVVPTGDGPLDLPDIRLESLAWVKMLGRPAAEIEATDMEGKPVKLADYRGKYVVLAFCSAANEGFLEGMLGLIEVQKRFKHRPLTILALHDASLNSLAKYRQALDPLRNKFAGEIPIRFLLDRSPIGAGTGPYALKSGESGSGRTADSYEIVVESTFVIDEGGRMVFAAVRQAYVRVTNFTVGKDGELVRNDDDDTIGIGGEFRAERHNQGLVWALEDQFGLPRSALAGIPRRNWEPPDVPKGPLVVKGKLVDPNGKPVADAKLSVESYRNNSERNVNSGPSGEFSIKLDEVRALDRLTVEAPDFATRVFSFHFGKKIKIEDSGDVILHIEPTGVIPEPLCMGPGVEVKGRVVRDGMPVAGVTIGLNYLNYTLDHPWEALETKTDARGTFRFPHVLPETNFWAYAKVGSVENQGAVIPLPVHTTKEGSAVDLGELHVQKGRTLAGRVVFTDGKSPPHGMYLVASCPKAEGSLKFELDDTGRFAFAGLPEGPVEVSAYIARKLQPLGYRLSPTNKCLDPQIRVRMVGQLDHDIDDLTILFEPSEIPEQHARVDVDPAVMADFNDAQAGPITGVPPKDYPPK